MSLFVVYKSALHGQQFPCQTGKGNRMNNLQIYQGLPVWRMSETFMVSPLWVGVSSYLHWVMIRLNKQSYQMLSEHLQIYYYPFKKYRKCLFPLEVRAWCHIPYSDSDWLPWPTEMSCSGHDITLGTIISLLVSPVFAYNTWNSFQTWFQTQTFP